MEFLGAQYLIRLRTNVAYEDLPRFSGPPELTYWTYPCPIGDAIDLTISAVLTDGDQPAAPYN